MTSKADLYQYRLRLISRKGFEEVVVVDIEKQIEIVEMAEQYAALVEGDTLCSTLKDYASQLALPFS